MDERERFENLLKEYSDVMGSIGFERHIEFLSRFVEESVFIETEGGFNKHDFIINKKAISYTLKFILELAKEHNVKGQRCWIDWEDYR